MNSTEPQIIDPRTVEVRKKYRFTNDAGDAFTGEVLAVSIDEGEEMAIAIKVDPDFRYLIEGKEWFYLFIPLRPLRPDELVGQENYIAPTVAIMDGGRRRRRAKSKRRKSHRRTTRRKRST